MMVAFVSGNLLPQSDNQWNKVLSFFCLILAERRLKMYKDHPLSRLFHQLCYLHFTNDYFDSHDNTRVVTLAMSQLCDEKSLWWSTDELYWENKTRIKKPTWVAYRQQYCQWWWFELVIPLSYLGDSVGYYPSQSLTIALVQKNKTVKLVKVRSKSFWKQLI